MPEMLLTNPDVITSRSRTTGPLIDLARKSFTGRLQVAPPLPPPLVAENVSVEYGAGRATALALEDVSVAFQPGKSLPLKRGVKPAGVSPLSSGRLASRVPVTASSQAHRFMRVPFVRRIRLLTVS